MDQNTNQPAYRAYGYRWVVLAVYGLATAIIQLMWATFFAIPEQSVLFYNVAGTGEIDTLSVIFMVGMIVLSFPVMAAFEKFGFKKAVGFGVVVTAICGIVRAAVGASYIGAVIATIGFAVAQPFILNSPGIVAGKWFPENERATANSIGLLCSYVGMAIGLLLTPVLMDAGMDLGKILWAYGIAAVVVAVLFVIFIKDAPPTPPCAEEAAVRVSFKEGMKGCMTKKNFVLGMVGFLIVYGIFNTFFTKIGGLMQTLSEGAVSETQSGVLGVVILIAGIIGSLVQGMVSDKDKKQRRLMYAVIANVIGLIGMALFLVFKTYGAMMVASIVYGFFTIGSAPLMLTFAAETSYPTSEGTSEGMMMWSGNISGALFVLGAELFGTNMKALMITMVALTIVALIPLLIAKERKASK